MFMVIFADGMGSPHNGNAVRTKWLVTRHPWMDAYVCEGLRTRELPPGQFWRPIKTTGGTDRDGLSEN